MTALKEIKNRIISVRSTLKITSAMKMVASAKLHRVQAVATSLGEYERRLSEIAAVLSSDSDIETASPLFCRHEKEEKATIVAFSSNSSLCGGFNTNAYRALTKEIEQLHDEGFKQIQVIPIGAKIAQSAIKGGYDVDNSFNTLTEKSTYNEIAKLANYLIEEYIAGHTDKIILVYNHFHSIGHQAPVNEVYLPMTTVKSDGDNGILPDYIFEPDAKTLIAELIPYKLRTQLYSVWLDSTTAEHAARTVAMQTATDNAKKLLDELSLTYNKRRQQAITDELADINSND